METEAGGPRRGGGAGRLIAAGVGLYLLAILVARLLVAGGGAWVFLAFLSLLLLLILASRLGFKAALVIVVLFCSAAAGFRWFMLGGFGWPALLLLPVVVVTAAIAGRVVAAMRQDRRLRAGTGASGDASESAATAGSRAGEAGMQAREPEPVTRPSQ